MSPREWKFRINDILDSITRIGDYTDDMAWKTFQSDKKTIDAVTRNFIIIGEASHHIPQIVCEQYPDIPWRLMSDMRNFAVHEYWGVSLGVIWKTLQEDLPALKLQLVAMAKAEGC